MSTECDRIAYQLASTINGEAWYGDTLRQILDGVTAKQAYAHPVPNAHSIWELLGHVESWVKFALGAVDGVPIPPWPAITREPVWKQVVDSFFSHHLKLVETIKAFSDERLEATVPGRTYNFYRLFQSTTQHAVYHAGQIALLKKNVPE
jgi:DinB family protein